MHADDKLVVILTVVAGCSLMLSTLLCTLFDFINVFEQV